jgi:transcriptional regulator with XRE-family HTH domain
MEIGSKLKNARMKMEMTQEKVAEEIGVSRQTISNWENNKSFPDIISVIHLSNLYSVSLDELLKEDVKMMEYLEQSTNEVKSRQKLSKLIQIISYLLIWAMVIIWYWMGGADEDAMGYSLVVFYMLLPISTFVISVFIGKDSGWANYKWMMLLFFGFMYMLAAFATFALGNTVATGNVNYPEITDTLPGILCSTFGMLIGTIVGAVKKRKANRLND